MLLNLKRLYVKWRSFPQARMVTDLLLALTPNPVAELRDRGLLAYHMNDFPAALRDLEEYLKRSKTRAAKSTTTSARKTSKCGSTSRRCADVWPRSTDRSGARDDASRTGSRERANRTVRSDGNAGLAGVMTEVGDGVTTRLMA